MFPANVARMLIASPGDVLAERDLARETAWRWSSVHGKQSSLVLLPTMWERDSTPSMRDRPQGVINSQLVDEADLLVGFFWTRLGTPTGEAESGTVEEIERVIDAGRPVLLYFSRQPVVPDSLDAAEYARLQEWKKTLRDRGLYHDYDTIDELRDKLYDDITRTVQSELNVPVMEMAAAGGARLLARTDHERTQSFDTKGRPRTRHHHRLIIENVGAAVAEDVEFELDAGDSPAPQIFRDGRPFARLAPGAAATYTMAITSGAAWQFDVKLAWREGDEAFTDVQTVNIH